VGGKRIEKGKAKYLVKDDSRALSAQGDKFFEFIATTRADKFPFSEFKSVVRTG
jgi:ribosomal protein L24E